MTVVERRLASRQEVTMPIRFRTLGTNAAQILTGESQNFSEGGIYFTTSPFLKLQVGTLIELFLTLPGNAEGTIDTGCTARIVHLEPNVGPNRSLGVGASIERFEPRAARAVMQG